MCRILASDDPSCHERQTRSIRMNGQSTSIRLERAFWDILDAMALHQGYTTPQLLSELQTEILELRGEVNNFTSLLRCTCLRSQSLLGQIPQQVVK
ncbi:Predicted DNA-binding protein, contains Ribbon-helix-helix (RHH) domain [Gemmobacter aquatilis]|uniref:Predicted DNA-binding protein, contains Ribbon-helix-helix (RHH) domain n=1 Tax=Gemmobacter aquatilis TaxID=933059 RepID=A0A1H7Z1E6_9RHOB|nr:ribbon-helix-helix domain-containing protein [Gemmobacter aquatilis]SEM52035.1 Predicted DNA-binding protein, contains Ribbon-helix-helix (RHH) domain [Gemmobacter aquatilis]